MNSRNISLIFVLACQLGAAFAYEDDSNASASSDDSITGYLISTPVERALGSFTTGIALGVSTGAVRTTITRSGVNYIMPEGLIGALGEFSLGYMVSLPYQLYTGLEAFIDARSSVAEFESPASPSISYAFRTKSVGGINAAAGWIFARGDILYAKAGLNKSKWKRTGYENADVGQNLSKAFRDVNSQVGVGYQMPNSDSTYLRFEYTMTPKYGAMTNNIGTTLFAYQPVSSEFKVGLQYYFTPFPVKTNDFTSLRVSGIYGVLSITHNSYMLDHTVRSQPVTGTSQLASTWIQPSFNNTGGYGLGYSNSLASRNLYAGFEISRDENMSQKKSFNVTDTQGQDYRYEQEHSDQYSAIIGYRPHPSDLLFTRFGVTNTKLKKVNSNTPSLILNHMNLEGAHIGLGFETSLLSLFSLRGMYTYTTYGNAIAQTVTPTNYAFSMGVVLRA